MKIGFGLSEKAMARDKTKALMLCKKMFFAGIIKMHRVDLTTWG